MAFPITCVAFDESKNTACPSSCPLLSWNYPAQTSLAVIPTTIPFSGWQYYYRHTQSRRRTAQGIEFVSIYRPPVLLLVAVNVQPIEMKTDEEQRVTQVLWLVHNTDLNVTVCWSSPPPVIEPMAILINYHPLSKSRLSSWFISILLLPSITWCGQSNRPSKSHILSTQTDMKRRSSEQKMYLG